MTQEDVEVVFTCSNTGSNTGENWETHADQQTVVLLNVHQDETLINEGLSRELTNRIQKMRKDAKLHHIHVATAYCAFKSDGQLLKVATEYLDQIARTTATDIRLETPAEGVETTLEQSHKVQWSNKTMEEDFEVCAFLVDIGI